MKVGILGSGNVGKSLARGICDLGHDVTMGARNAATLSSWLETNPDVTVASHREAATGRDLVILCVPGTAAEEALTHVADQLAPGAIVIDTCDPFASLEPVESVLPLFTAADESLLERLQLCAPHVRLVKSFNTVGAQFMAQPSFPGGPPSMFLCGDDAEARATVSDLLRDLGWDPVEAGGARSARVLEPMASLYCAIGDHSGEWNMAFKLLRLEEP